MAVLCGMPVPASDAATRQQYSIRLEELRYLCTSCLLPAFDEA